MLVGMLMAPRVVTCNASDTLERAAQLMWEHDVGFLPVVASERVVGVITDRDVLMRTYTCGISLRDEIVGTAMSHELVTCTLHEDAVVIEHRMAAHQIRRLPVIDASGKPVGVVTLADLARSSLRGHELSPRGPTCTLAAITRPRTPAG